MFETFAGLTHRTVCFGFVAFVNLTRLGPHSLPLPVVNIGGFNSEEKNLLQIAVLQCFTWFTTQIDPNYVVPCPSSPRKQISWTSIPSYPAFTPVQPRFYIFSFHARGIGLFRMKYGGLNGTFLKCGRDTVDG